MVITKILGGLGNQMFQYSAGRALALKLGVELKIDISGFEGHELRDYYLNAFNIKEALATKEETESIKRLTKKKTLLGKLFGSKKQFSSVNIKEKPLFAFNEDFLKLGDNVLLSGYWQNEKYFKDIGSTLREDFTLKHPLCEKSKEVEKNIENCSSVSIHIRRGDYVSNPKVNSQFGLCTIDYYHRGIKYLEENVGGDLKFFIFSDDPQWAVDNLDLQYDSTVVDHNGADRCFEDLILMSNCKHNIIANSTFSWWAAWLNNNKDKIVVAPEAWFQDNKYDTSDLVPKEWVRV